MKYDPNFILQRNIKNLFNVNGTFEDEQLFELISRVKSDADVMRKERDEALERVTARDKHILHEINHFASSVITKPLDCMRDVYALVYGLAAMAAAPDTTQPQLSEIRYVLHGDIQPCSVLYSDDTTTLLRLDEGDIMCETDTIEWSDSVTYRCQELLRSTVGETGKQGYRMVNAMAQLVRDERILLNDNGGAKGEAVEFTYALYVGECVQTGAYPLSFTNWCGQDKPHHMVADVERVAACHKWESKLNDHLASQPKQER